MRVALCTLCLLLSAAGLRCESMPRAVSSWEGEFGVVSEVIKIDVVDLSPLRMWIYRLNGGSEGTALGFSDASGVLLLAPNSTNRGVQPVYRAHFVNITPDGRADVIVVYDVQGQGGITSVEVYAYDGKQISLVSASFHGGRHDPVWRRIEVGANQ